MENDREYILHILRKYEQKMEEVNPVPEWSNPELHLIYTIKYKCYKEIVDDLKEAVR